MKTIDTNEVYTLFEEIKELIKKENNNKPIIEPQIEMPDLSALNELTEKLDKTIEEARKPVKTEYRHIFSIESNIIFFGFIGLFVACLYSFFTIYNQRNEISSYEDTDWKFRYIKMQGEITPQKLINLENIFENKRDSVKVIRNEVQKYEKALSEEAKRLEQVRLKEQEAERLRQEAEKLKHGK